MTNPVISARLKMGLTRSELSQEANIALVTLQYIETGSYGTLPERIGLILEPVNRNLTEQYEVWKLHRRLATEMFIPPPSLEDFPQLDDIMHPHMEFRGILGVSLNHYTRELCIARNVVQSFESGRQQAFPMELYNALSQTLGVDLTLRLKKACGLKDACTHEVTASTHGD